MSAANKDNLYLNTERNLGLGRFLRRQEEVLRGTEHRPVVDGDDPKAACSTDESVDSEDEENAA